jgi:hypothetical protein
LISLVFILRLPPWVTLHYIKIREGWQLSSTTPRSIYLAFFVTGCGSVNVRPLLRASWIATLAAPEKRPRTPTVMP